MKRKNLFLLAAIATALTGLPSCSSDDAAEATDNTPAELKITASMVASVEGVTRAASNIQGTTPEDFTKIGIYVWYTGQTGPVTSPVTYNGYENDRVASYTGSGPYTLTPTTNTTMYFPIDNANVDVYLYAPYKDSPTQTAMKMEHTVADDQSQKSGYLESDFIYGKATTDYNNNKEASVTMYHAMSKIIFKVEDSGVNPDKMMEISLKNIYKKTTINMPQNISNSALTCGSADTDNVGTASESGDVKVWGTSEEGEVSVEDAKSSGVAVVVPPQTTPNDAVVSITVDTKTASADFKSISLDPGKVYTYNLKLIGQSLTIKLVSITDWISNDSASDLEFSDWTSSDS